MKSQLNQIVADMHRTELVEDILYCGVMSFLGMLPVAAIIIVAWGAL